MEQSYPLMIERYCIRKGSGGQGRWRGGDGLVRRYLFLEDATVTLLTDRRRNRPYGLCGGGPGKAGKNLLFKKDSQTPVTLPDKMNIDVSAGDSIEIRTPGGGGYGPVPD
jgi:N-methylhydantoinase B